MAVYTRVPFAELEQFVSAYAIGELRKVREIAAGVENSNYLLVTAQGRYILTLYEKRVKEADLPFFIAMMQRAAAHGVPCPAPVADRAGRVLQRLHGKPATVISFLEGDKMPEPSPAQCHAAGVLLAQLHAACAGMDTPCANALGPQGWQSLAADILGADILAPGLQDLIDSQTVALLKAWPRPDALARGVIHGDFFPDNVFFKDGQVSGVIDFYFACEDFYAYDLAIAVNAWCFENCKSYAPARAAALLEGYESLRPLSEEEKAALPLLLRGVALRFLLTRSYDLLNHRADALVKPHDPLEYREKLLFFRDTTVLL